MSKEKEKKKNFISIVQEQGFLLFGVAFLVAILVRHFFLR